MAMYDLIEYSDNYSKTSGSLWQYYRDEPFFDDNDAIADFPVDNNNSSSFKFKQKITSKTANGSIKDVKIIVPLKNLSNFWRTLKMSLINCQIDLMLIFKILTNVCYLLIQKPKHLQ